MSTTTLTTHMAAAATDLINALTAEERERLCAPREARVGMPWYFTPAERDGIALADLTPRVQQLVLKLLQSGLSDAGFALATYIMGLENLLDFEEGWPTIYPGRPNHGRARDPQLYFLKILGDPNEQNWGWQFSGHHLVVHVFIEEGKVVSLTPHFIGVNPALAPSIGRNTFQPLRGEEIIAAEIVARLNADERARAVFAELSPSDILQQNRPIVDDAAEPLSAAAIYPSYVPKDQVIDFLGSLGIDEASATSVEHPAELTDFIRTAPSARGVLISTLDVTTQGLVSELLTHYICRFPEETHRTVFGWSAGEDLPADLRFAWAGTYSTGIGRYYCLDSELITIEFDNTQNKANHIHSAMRSRRTDFASDILRAHYLTEHPDA